jgi:hypothetical protein
VRNILIVIMIIAMGVLLYKAYQSGAFDRRTPGKTPQEAVHGVVSAGENLGNNTRNALDKVRIPGS